jgi:hypothetical protein
MSYVVVCPRKKTVCVYKKTDESRGCGFVSFDACKPHGEKTPSRWETPEDAPLHWKTRDGAVNHIDHLIHLHGSRREDLAVGEWSAADGVKADSASMDSNQTEQVRK